MIFVGVEGQDNNGINCKVIHNEWMKLSHMRP